jgi:hypothetical protein
MSGVRRDSNGAHGVMQDFYDARLQWIGAAVFLLLVGGVFLVSLLSGKDLQVASNSPAIEILGSSPLPAPHR